MPRMQQGNPEESSPAEQRGPCRRWRNRGMEHEPNMATMSLPTETFSPSRMEPNMLTMSWPMAALSSALMLPKKLTTSWLAWPAMWTLPKKTTMSWSIVPWALTLQKKQTASCTEESAGHCDIAAELHRVAVGAGRGCSKHKRGKKANRGQGCGGS